MKTKTQHIKLNEPIETQLKYLSEKFEMNKSKLIKKMINEKYMDLVTGYSTDLV
jgi:predicted DNA-binding protein